MRLRFVLSAGIVDAGTAAAASLVVQVYAVRVLSTETLGVYALFLATFVFASLISTFLVLRPSQVGSLAWEQRDRLSLISPTARIGALVGLFAGSIVIVTELFVPASTATETRVALGVTAVAITVLSPIQDHVRRMFHLSGASWLAAGVSGIQLIAIVASVTLLAVSTISRVWIPMGALAIANAISLTIGVVIARRRSRNKAVRAPRLKELFASGRWLLVAGLVPPATRLISGVLVVALAGATALGYYEAARVVARPIMVLITGLLAALGPRSMEAAAERKPGKARRSFRVLATVVLALTVPYLVVVGFDWGLNPVAGLMEKAYVMEGLVAVAIAGNIVNGLLMIRRAELMGGRAEKPLAFVETGGAAAAVGFAGGAGVFKAFTIPLGLLATGLVRWFGYGRARRAMYAAPPVQPPDHVLAATQQRTES